MKRVFQKSCRMRQLFFDDRTMKKASRKNLFLDKMHKRTKDSTIKNGLTGLVKQKLSTIKKRCFRAYLTYTRSYTHYPQKKRGKIT